MANHPPPMRQNQRVSNADHSLGLRERKKHKTRDTKRRETFRLIKVNGYANTTVEQTAEVAEVSPSTFFRYFPSKESVLLADDMDPVLLDSLVSQPPERSPIEAIRRAYQATIAAMSPEERGFENNRQRLIFSIPELKAAQLDEYYRTIKMLTEALGRRLGRDPNDFEVRAFAGALTGAMFGLVDEVPMSERTVYRALDFLEAGMPLKESRLTSKP